MPTYEYLCDGCGEKFDFFQSMTSPPLKKHPDCKHSDSSVKRIVSGGSGLIFKGSGFYLTDYKNKKQESKKSISNAIKFSFIFSVPSATGIFLLSNEIVSFLFERGAFDSLDSVLTSKSLVALSVGLPAFILIKSK